MSSADLERTAGVAVLDAGGAVHAAATRHPASTARVTRGS
jgi:hypothetical protein